jgi:hypothetical protein
MLLHQVKDIIREYAGKTGLPTTMLDLCLENARLDIEKFQNFWWMQADLDWLTVVDQAAYPLKVDTTNGLEITNFKDIRALKFKEETEVDWQPVDVGTHTKEDLDSMYDEDETGDPELAVVEGDNLILYPIPDDEYDVRIYYWEYTSNTTNLESDELTAHFPMALVYAAYKWIHEVYLKDPQGATYWRQLLEGKGGELFKMRRENFKRGWKDKVNLEPHMGPGQRGRRRLDRMQIYR